MKKYLFFILLIGLMIVPASASLDGFHLIKTLSFPGSGFSSDQTNYQLRFTFYNTTGSDSSTLSEYYLGGDVYQANWSDLRITTSTDALCDYWISNNTTSSVDVWVEVPTFYKSSTNYLRIYGGNTTVSSVSNGTNTFIFFDDFDTFDDSKWDKTSGVNISGGILTIPKQSGDKISSHDTFGSYTALDTFMYTRPGTDVSNPNKSYFGYSYGVPFPYDAFGTLEMISFVVYPKEYDVYHGKSTLSAHSLFNYMVYDDLYDTANNNFINYEMGRNGTTNLAFWAGTRPWGWIGEDGIGYRYAKYTDYLPTHDLNIWAFNYGDYNLSIDYVFVRKCINFGTDVEASSTDSTHRSISVSGYTYDATTNLTLPNVTVSFLQGSTWVNTTSDETGYYEIPYSGGLFSDTSTELCANLTDYTFEPYNHTFNDPGTYDMDIPMIPSGWAPPAGESYLYGLALLYGYNTPLSGVTLTCNGTTNVSTSTGFYLFTNLTPNTTFTLEGTKTGYQTETMSVTTGPSGNATQDNIFLKQYYNVSLDIKDYVTSQYITSTVYGQIGSNLTNTSTGHLSWRNITYGTYDLQVWADGYTSVSTSVNVYDDINETIYLRPVGYLEDSSLDYTIPPRVVRFICIDNSGNGVPNVQVTAQGIETTLPDWGILNVIFGWTAAYSNSSLSNDTMVGATDNAGEITFMMTESLGYHMAFLNSARGVNQSLDIYPKDDTIIIPLTTSDRNPFRPIYTPVNITLWSTEPNASYTTLWALYDDPNLHTTAINFTVRNSSGAVIYSNLTTGVNILNESYTVNHTTGNQYLWGMVSAQTDFGNASRYMPITLHSRIVDLGLEEMYYVWISLILLFLFVAMFSSYNTIYGYVCFGIMIGIFWYIGWLPVTSPYIVPAIIILAIVMFLSKKKARGEGT